MVRLAFQSWSGVPTAPVSFLEGPATTAADAALDGINLVSATPASAIPVGTLSLTVIYSHLGSVPQVDPFGRPIEFPGQILEADILFNPAIPFSTDLAAVADRIDLQSRATHEAGHLLGLDHSGLLPVFGTRFESNSRCRSKQPPNEEFTKFLHHSTAVWWNISVSGQLSVVGGQLSVRNFQTTDASGRIRLEGVAWEDVEAGAWQDPEFIRLYEESGKPVRVGESGRESIELQLIPYR